MKSTLPSAISLQMSAPPLQVPPLRSLRKDLLPVEGLWRRPSLALAIQRQEFGRLECALHERFRLRVAQWQARYTNAATRLRLLSPMNVLERGYSITLEADTGRVVRQAATARVGQKLRTQ